MAATTASSPVVADYQQFLSDADVAVAVAVIKALTGVIRRSEASTMMQMEGELQAAAQQLKNCPYGSLVAAATTTAPRRYQNPIATTAACELFLRFVTRSFLEFDDFDVCKAQLIDRGNLFAETSLLSRQRIAEVGHNFIRDGMRVLTHGTSRAVSALLREAAKTKHFSVFITEGRSDEWGTQTVATLAAAGIPTTVILDAAVGYYMEQIDMVIVGAEGVVENGGIVNSTGTFSTAVVARAMNKPFYVAAESYKFARLYPLTQRDLPQTQQPGNGAPPAWSKSVLEAATGAEEAATDSLVTFENPLFDYTPAEYIALMFTDLGVLTPSAVSDELIKLYQ